MKIKIRQGSWSFKSLIRWAIAFLIIALSGCVYFTQVQRRNSTIVLLVLTVYVLFVERKGIKQRVFITAAAFVFALLVNYYANLANMTGSNMMDYTLLVIEIFCVAVYCSVESLDAFAHKYVRIMECIALVSLVCFVIQISSQSLVSALANTTILQGYSISWYHTWGWTYIFNRNAGPFWEPGAFQGYLFVAIMFLMMRGKIKDHLLEYALLAITVLTTMSTTGYILLAVIGLYVLMLYNNQSMKSHKNVGFALLRILFIGVAVVIGIQLLLNSATISGKFVSTNQSFAYRLLHITHSLSIAMENPIFGYGMMSESLINAWSAFGVASNSVGIFAILQYFGIIWGGVYVVMSLIASIKVYNKLNWVVVLGVFLILHFTESLLTYPLYFAFVFWANKQKRWQRGSESIGCKH